MVVSKVYNVSKKYASFSMHGTVRLDTLGTVLLSVFHLEKVVDSNWYFSWYHLGRVEIPTRDTGHPAKTPFLPPF